MHVLRDGYWRDVAVHLCLVILIGSMFAFGVAWAVDAFFGDAVRGLVGEAGEYDMLIQVRTEHRTAAESDLAAIIDQRLPGARLDEGVSIAGHTYYFVRIPDALRSKETFESIGELFEPVTGFIGHTLMVEPTVAISGIHEALIPAAEELARGLPAVHFTFHHGDKLVAVLHRPEDAAVVQSAFNALLDEHELVEIRLPVGRSVASRSDIRERLEETASGLWGAQALRGVHFSAVRDDEATLLTTLRELRTFLLSYATQVFVPGAEGYVGRRLILQPEVPDGHGAVEVQMEGVREGGAWGFVVQGTTEGRSGPWLAYERLTSDGELVAVGPATLTNERQALAVTLDESVRLLSNLSAFAEAAQESVAEADGIVTAFNEAIGKLGTLEQQIQGLQQALAGVGGAGEATPAEALAGVLVSSWLNRLRGGEAPPVTQQVGGSLQELDVSGIEATLRMLADGVSDLAALDVATVIEQIEQMQRALPLFSDSEIAESVQLIDRYLADGRGGDERITLLLRPGTDLAGAEEAFGQALGASGLRLVKTAGGVIAPNARAALSHILGQMRELVAALCTLTLALFVLFFDYSLLLSMERAAGAGPKDETHRPRSIHLAGGALGAFLVGTMALLSGARLPLVGWPGLLGLGAASGLATAFLAPRINPVDESEIVAGQALGLDHRRIMHEIVVPAARPGLLVYLNRRQQTFG